MRLQLIRRGFLFIIYFFIMRYIIDIEPKKTSIEVEKINDKLCMVTIWQNDDCIELAINEQQLYDLIGAFHLVQNQMKRK